MTEQLFEKIDPKSLNARQKEIYNFQKIASVLADFGFNCIKLSDDWKGADFIACHIDGTTIKVQLKGRLTIQKKYLGKDLWMAFPVDGFWFLVPHDKLVEIVEGEVPSALKNRSWLNDGNCNWHNPDQETS